MNSHPGDIATLARAGKQAQAIEAATAALAAPRLSAARRLALLEQRAEALTAEGRFGDAARDADAMLALAGSTPGPRIRALRCQALALMRLSRNKPALAVAEQALALAEQGRDRAALAQSVLCLAEAQLRTAAHDAALASAQRAADLFNALADVQGSGRAHWLIAFAQTRLSDNAASRTAALHAAALARQAGDGLGLANALNVLSFSCTDIAERLQVLRQAEEAFERAGNQFGRSMVLGNLSLTFGELGLWRHACRLGEQCMSIAERIGARLNVALEMGAVLKWQVDLGDLAGARARWSRYDALVSSLDEPVTGNDRELWAAELQVAEGDTAGALKRLRAFLRRMREDNSGFELYVQIPLARVLLQRGDAAAALRATQRGIGLLRERGFARTGFGQSQDIWWWHHRALATLGRDDEAWAALQQAHGLMLAGVRNLHDEGLRRSYLNKLQVNRALVPAWLADAARRGLPDAQRLEHLHLASSLADPFKRLVDSGLRLNQLRSEAALHDFLIDELTELSGAERVLLVLEVAGTRHIAGALLPAGEDSAALLQAVTPWLDEAASTREPALRHGPEGAAPEDQRSCLVAPLVAQGELLGHVYADIGGAFGRFGDADRDLLAMLAGQAAVALANLRFAGGLEAQVAERTAQARDAQAQADQRASELAVINSIQQGMAAQLEFQAIVNLAGDKLREVFATGDIGIRILDGSGSQMVAPYFYARGVRHDAPAMPVAKVRPGGAMDRVLHGETLVARNRAEQAALGVRPVPGVEQSHSFVTVPIKAGDRVVGGLTLENMERENAFGEPEVRLLETVAASMGVAMENARLFKSMQEALQQQTATAEVLQVISSSVADAQPVLDKILESCRQLIDAQVLVISLVGEDGRLHVGGTRLIGLEGRPGWSQAELDAGDERIRSIFPIALEGTGTALAIARGHVLNYPDVLHGADVPEGVRTPARSAGRNCSQLMAPLMQGERGIGSIALQRADLGGFTPKEEALLKTFADQAVIAIQNAKMFRETNEALERQTATAEVLKVIAGSPSDVQPVFDAIAERARALCGAAVSLVTRFDGEGALGGLPRRVAGSRRGDAQRVPGAAYECLAQRPRDPRPQSRWKSPMSGSIPTYDLKGPAAQAGYRSESGGTDAEGRPRHRLDRRRPPRGGAVSGTSDQAAADLRRPGGDRGREHTAVQRDAERHWPTRRPRPTCSRHRLVGHDAPPVFDKIVDSGAQLLRTRDAGDHAGGCRDGCIWSACASAATRRGPMAPDAARQQEQAVARSFPTPLAGSATERVIRTGQIAEVPDVQNASDVPALQKFASVVGHNFAALTAPLMWDGQGIGAIVLSSTKLGPFSEQEQALLKTFADQAVIAIQNTRLFNETQEALAHQTASADILRVISSSPTDVQPVFEAIVGTAVKHLGCDLALVQTVSGDTYSPKAMATPAGLTPVPGAQLMPVDPDANFPSRAIRSKTMLHVSDWSAVELPPHEQVRHEQLGLNSALYLPLLRGDECVGVLVLGSKKANAFNHKAIALAESFRDQALIAIENTRLFNETQEALERQTATAEVLQVDRRFGVRCAAGVRDDSRQLRATVRCHRHDDHAGRRGRAVASPALASPNCRAKASSGLPRPTLPQQRMRTLPPMPLAAIRQRLPRYQRTGLNYLDVLNGADVPRRGVRAPATGVAHQLLQLTAPMMQGRSRTRRDRDVARDAGRLHATGSKRCSRPSPTRR